MRAALLRQGPQCDRPFTIAPEDLHRKVRQRLRHSLIVFVVDASDSMGDATARRMAAAKGAVLALLTTAYQQRDRVAVVVFRAQEAEVLLGPTTSVTRARERLQKLATGGATPLADGLTKAWDIVRTERRKRADIRPLLILLSDGEANVPLQQGAEVMPELLSLAERVAADNIRSIVIDTKPLSATHSEMRLLAEALHGTYHHIFHLQAGQVLGLVRAEQEAFDTP